MRRHFILATAVGLPCVCSPAFAQTTWTGANGSDASLAANWSAGAPTGATTARFNLPLSTLTFSSNLSAAGIEVDNGLVFLNLASRTFSAGPVNFASLATSPAARSGMIVEGGRLQTSSSVSVGRTGGTVSYLDVLGAGSVESAGDIRIADSINASAWLRVIGQSSTVGAQNLSVAGQNNSSGDVYISGGGSVALGSNLIVGDSFGSSRGAVYIDGATSRLVAFNATIGGAATGSLVMTNGAVANVLSTLDLGNFGGAGSVSLADASTLSAAVVNVGSSSGTSSLTVSSGSQINLRSTSGDSRIFVNSSAQLNDARLTMPSGRRMVNEGVIRGSGQIIGAIDNRVSGRLVVPLNARLLVDSSSTTNLNTGVIAVDGGELHLGRGLNNDANGLMTVRNGTVSFGSGGSFERYNGQFNSGIAFTGGNSTVFGDVALNSSAARITHTNNSNVLYHDDVLNNGVIQTSPGSTATFLGSVAGTGSYTGSGQLIFEGDLRPGASPGVTSFRNPVFFGSASSIEIEIGGTAAADYDRVVTTDFVTGDLTFRIKRWNGFTPLPGMVFGRILSQNFDVLRPDSIRTINETGLAGLRVNAVQLDEQFIDLFISGTAGDANLDNAVGFADLLVLAANYNQLSGRTWLDGDFNADGAVNFPDLLQLASNYGQTFAADWALAQSMAAVPEPASIAMVAIASSLLLRRRR
jgi:subtilase-type serine protease